MNRRLIASASPLAAVIFLTACGGDEPTPPAKTVTVTAEAKTSESTTATTTMAPLPAPPTTTEAPAAPASWVMPSAIGMNLQDAQDGMQALTGNPFFVTLSEDATGQGRNQVLDANWKVCAQTPEPGASFTAETKIVFYSVKLNEPC